MKYYPVYLDLRGRRCLVVGGGQVAERKALTLLDAGADVTVISPSLTGALRALSESGRITCLSRTFQDGDISGFFLVIAATGSRDVNAAVAGQCRNGQVLVNVAAPPEESTFILPSVVDRGDLLIAISTSGASPALARKIRKELEERYGREYGLFLGKMTSLRKRLRGTGDEARRRAVFQALADSDVLDLLRQGREREADGRIEEISRREMQ